MPVRNVSSFVGNVKPIPVEIFIPPAFSVIWKVELEKTTGETYDVTDYLIEGSTFSYGVTDTVGSFNVKIIDPNQTYSNLMGDFDYVNVYLDYGTTATSLRFKGVIERRNRDDVYSNFSGRGIGMITQGKNVIYSAKNKARSDVLTEIIEANFSTIDTTNIETDDTLITVNYSEVPFQEIVQEICSKHHDFYISPTFEAHYFTRGSRLNTTEAVVQDRNHIFTEEYGEDSEEVVSKIRVYGDNTTGVPLFASSTSDTTHTKGIVKEKRIDDGSIKTFDQAKDRADFEYTSLNNIPSIGSVTSLLLPTLAPGEKVKMAIPVDGIDPDYYTIQSFEHTLPDLDTKLIINQRKLDISKIIRKNIQNVDKIYVNDNPYDLDFSKVINFESTSGTFNNTEIKDDYLIVSEGNSTGSWTSDEISFSDNIFAIYFKTSGNNLITQYTSTTSVLYFSLDGGNSWTPFVKGTTQSPSNSKSLIIKMVLNSSDAQLKNIAFQYSL